MIPEKNEHKGCSYLAESIRIQKALKKKRHLEPVESEGQLKKIEADVDFLLELREITRDKLARELHDGLTQTAATLAMRVNYARRLLENDRAAAVEELGKVERLTRLTAREIRYMIFSLRPVELESKGLGPALETMAEKLTELFDLHIHLSLDSKLLQRLEVNKMRLIYLLIEETIDLLRRKASPGKLWLSFRPGEEGLAVLEVLYDSTSVSTKIEDNRELDDLRDHAGVISAIVNVREDGPNSRGIQMLLPVDEICTEA